MSSRLVNFADGFSSASPPSNVGGVSQEDYYILNNQSSPVNLLTVDGKGWFVDFRLKRKTDSSEFYQQGIMWMKLNGTSWELTFGNQDTPSDDISMIADGSIDSPRQVLFALDVSTGELDYTSGNISGANYTSELIMSITRLV